MASGGGDGVVNLWDAATGRELRKLAGLSGAIWSLAFSPDGATVASGLNVGVVVLSDAASGVELRTLKGHARCGARQHSAAPPCLPPPLGPPSPHGHGASSCAR